jgi:hypothetical protein
MFFVSLSEGTHQVVTSLQPAFLGPGCSSSIDDHVLNSTRESLVIVNPEEWEVHQQTFEFR